MTSAHARYRRRLVLLADDDLVAGLVGPGPRHYGRFHPGQLIWATLVLEAGGTGLVTMEVAEAPLPGFWLHGELGHVRLSGPARDRDLPGLGPVLRGLDQARILRYRPHKRCTVRGSTADGERIVKVMAVGRDASTTVRLHRQQADLAAAQRRGQVSFRVAEPGTLDAAAGAVSQQIVPGGPIADRLLGHEGPALAWRLGEALGQLAGSPLDPPHVEGPTMQLARTARAVARLVDRVPTLGPAAGAVQRALAHGHRRLDPKPLVAVHGAPHMHQWLIEGDSLALVDFDRYARGEPELDIATLVAELESESGLVTSPDDIEAAAVAGFESAGALSLDPRRLALYRTHKRLAKATRSAWALRPDGDQRAARHLDRLAAHLSLER